MRLWFDEDLSPSLVQVANARGFEATCNRDRGMLGATDQTLRISVQAEEYVLVTDNASDFAPMYQRDDVHPGMVVMPGTVKRERQRALADALIGWIAKRAEEEGELPADYMVNRLVEIDETGECSARDLPPT